MNINVFLDVLLKWITSHNMKVLAVNGPASFEFNQTGFI